MDSFVFYKSFRDALRVLDPVDQAAMYNAISDYALDGIEPELTGYLAAMFILMRPQIDANTQRRENGKKGGRPKKTETDEEETEQEPNNNQTETKENQTITKNNQTETKENHTEPNVNVNVNDNVNVKERESNKEKERRFTPPTLDEVREYAEEYAREKGKPAINAERFCDFYAAKGWRIGKDKMKDWRAAVRNWTNDDTRKATPKPGSVVNFKQRSTSYADMMVGGNW